LLVHAIPELITQFEGTTIILQMRTGRGALERATLARAIVTIDDAAAFRPTVQPPTPQPERLFRCGSWLTQRRSTSRPGSPPLSTIRLLSPNVGQDCPGDRDRGEQNALDRER
jgi:hypothetical protein